MSPVFDSSVFDPSVFETDSGGMSAVMTGTGAFTGTLAAAIILLSGVMIGTGVLSGELLTAILLTALMSGTGDLTGDLKVARFMGRLTTCGEPLTTHCQDWILGNRDPRRDG